MTAEAKRTNSKSSWSHVAGLVLSPPLPLLLLEALGGFQIGAAEGVQVLPWAGSARWCCSLLVGEVGVLVELGLEPLHFLEMLDEGGAGVVALEVGHVLGLAGRGPATS